MFRKLTVAIALSSSALRASPTTDQDFFPPAGSVADCGTRQTGSMAAFFAEQDRKRLTNILPAINEPSLYATPRGTDRTRQAIRLIYARSFHPTIIVRIEWPTLGQKGHLVAKQMAFRNTSGRSVVDRQIDRVLVRAEINHLSESIHRAHLSQLPQNGCDAGMDGSNWTIESRDGNGYRIIYRWSPERGGFRDIGLELIELTKWDIGPIY